MSISTSRPGFSDCAERTRPQTAECASSRACRRRVAPQLPASTRPAAWCRTGRRLASPASCRASQRGEQGALAAGRVRRLTAAGPHAGRPTSTAPGRTPSASASAKSSIWLPGRDRLRRGQPVSRAGEASPQQRPAARRPGRGQRRGASVDAVERIAAGRGRPPRGRRRAAERADDRYRLTSRVGGIERHRPGPVRGRAGCAARSRRRRAAVPRSRRTAAAADRLPAPRPTVRRRAARRRAEPGAYRTGPRHRAPTPAA